MNQPDQLLQRYVCLDTHAIGLLEFGGLPAVSSLLTSGSRKPYVGRNERGFHAALLPLLRVDEKNL